jgi:hypothetical protein
MPRKKKTAPAASPVRIVDPPEPEDDVEESQDTPEAESASAANTQWAWVDEAIRSKSLDRLAEVLTDIERLKTELDTELANVKADLGGRIKTCSARRSDVIHEIEELTHAWVLDHAIEVAYLVHSDAEAKVEGLIQDRNDEEDADTRESLQRAIDAIAKKTRPMQPADNQESLPFAAEG